MYLGCFLDINTTETYTACAGIMANSTNKRNFFKCGKETKVFLKPMVSHPDKDYRNKGEPKDV